MGHLWIKKRKSEKKERKNKFHKSFFVDLTRIIQSTLKGFNQNSL